MPSHCYTVDLSLVSQKYINLCSTIMKKLFIFIFALSAISNALGQKKEIDLETIKNWERLGDFNISGDGNYLWYEVVSESKGTNLIVCDKVGGNRRPFLKGGGAAFSADSKYIFFNSPEGVHQIELKTGKDKIIAGASSYKIPSEGYGRWLAYNKGDDLSLEDLKTGEETHFSNVRNYFFNKLGNILLLQMDSSVLLIELPAKKKKVVVEGGLINHLIFDKAGQQVALIKTANKHTDIFNYQIKDNKLALIVSDSSAGIPIGYKIVKNDMTFSENGKMLFFKISENRTQAPKDVSIITKDVDVWSYKDMFLQSEQVFTPSRRKFTVAVSNQFKRVVRLEDDSTLLENAGNNFAVLKSIGNSSETYWRKSQLPKFKLISLIDGQTPTEIKIPVGAIAVQLSPFEKYITFIDSQTFGCNSIEISSGITREIARNLEVPPTGKRETFQMTLRLIQWIENDMAIIIQSQNDIWQIDPKNKIKPICLTGGYGKQKRLTFAVIKPSANTTLAPNDSLLLSVVDESTKYNGFSKVKLSKSNVIQIRSSGPYIYFVPSVLTERFIPPPKKARNAEVYILQRQSFAQEPNLFLTKDFNTLRPVSNIESHMKYKWHKSQLVRWTANDGTILQGILYFPDDLDTTKSYPIIFNYYEQRNHELFKFNDPSYLGVTFNVAWYLNKGYLVFIPDVLPAKGATGESALNSVVSAANFLTNEYRWIDKRRMGLQGHSHGGYITNYIITHSDLFAAAQSGSGYSDLARGYGDLGFSGASLQFMQEIGQNNLGTTPWADPSVYIENSPIFFVNKVNTPLLIMHNKDDGAVQFGQSVEFFTALRRLEKKVWLLQYDGEGHHISDFDRAYDFLIRQQQFFDYYLRHAAAPLWMVEGIPNKYKGIKSGLQLDTLGRNP